MAHFYGRAAAELSFSDFVLRTFTRTMKTVISYNSLELYMYMLHVHVMLYMAMMLCAVWVCVWCARLGVE